jgi:hypothetical protein
MYNAATGQLKENKTMTGIQFVTDEKGRKVAVQIDLKTHGAMWEDFRDGMVAESRRKEKRHSLPAVPRQTYKAHRRGLKLRRSELNSGLPKRIYSCSIRARQALSVPQSAIASSLFSLT